MQLKGNINYYLSLRHKNPQPASRIDNQMVKNYEYAYEMMEPPRVIDIYDNEER